MALRWFVDESALGLGKLLANTRADVIYTGHPDLPEVPLGTVDVAWMPIVAEREWVAPQFDELMRRATTVRVMPYKESNRVAYEAANEFLVSNCDTLFPVWDGQSGADKGGIASVVEYARSCGVPVEVIWSEGASRG